MANKTQTIRIESILGGHAPTTHFAAPDQFRTSYNINPALPPDDSFGSNGWVASGLLRPGGFQETTKEVLKDEPMWIISTPKDNTTYVYGHYGSVYTLTGSTLSGLGSLSDVTTYPHGNGAAYYDNYMYFATATNVARYGPLDGTPTFTKDYWVATLGKTALTEYQYPNDATLGLLYPCHVMHRHSDGRLYFADVVGGQGTIHYISTTKTTVEGDTDAGSKYSALQFGYGLVPTAIETYGSNLAIALLERRSGNYNSGDSFTGAKIAFWDTTSQNFNQIIWNSFPDGFISALKNINGILYIISGSFNSSGFRVSRYVGGDSFEEVAYFEGGQTPFPGAVDGDGTRLLFGSNTQFPVNRGCVWSYNLQKKSLGSGLFNVQGVTASSSVGLVTSLALSNNFNFDTNVPEYVGWTVNESNVVGMHGIDTQNYSYGTDGTVHAKWWSQTYRIGQRFKITKIRIPLVQPLSANMRVLPKIFTDNNNGNTSTTLTEINSTNFGTRSMSVVIRPENLCGENDFFLELGWIGSALCVVSLPITIEYELLDD